MAKRFVLGLIRFVYSVDAIVVASAAFVYAMMMRWYPCLSLIRMREQFLLAATENGYGKRTKIDDYRITKRGGQGVANIVTSERNGKVVASFAVTDEDQLMLATDQGKVIRIRVSGGEGDQIRITGRNTQGVTLFSIDENEKLVSVGVIQEKDTDDGDDDDSSDTGILDTESPETRTANPNAYRHLSRQFLTLSPMGILILSPEQAR